MDIVIKLYRNLQSIKERKVTEILQIEIQIWRNNTVGFVWEQRDGREKRGRGREELVTMWAAASGRIRHPTSPSQFFLC